MKNFSDSTLKYVYSWNNYTWKWWVCSLHFSDSLSLIPKLFTWTGFSQLFGYPFGFTWKSGTYLRNFCKLLHKIPWIFKSSNENLIYIVIMFDYCLKIRKMLSLLIETSFYLKFSFLVFSTFWSQIMRHVWPINGERALSINIDISKTW